MSRRIARPRAFCAVTAVWLAAGAGAVLPDTAHAQLSARPATLVFDGGAPESAITVRNEGGTPIQLRVFPADFDQSEAGRHRFLDFGTHPRSCRGRLTVSPERLIVQPGQEGVARVRVEPGAETCWSLVYAEYRPAEQGQVQAIRRVAVQVHGVSAGVVREAAVRDVTVDGGQVLLAFENQTDAPLRPEGRVEFRTPDGQVVGVAPIEPFGVLPGHVRRLGVALPPGLPAGTLLAVPILDFGADWLAGGQALFAHGG